MRTAHRSEQVLVFVLFVHPVATLRTARSTIEDTLRPSRWTENASLGAAKRRRSWVGFRHLPPPPGGGERVYSRMCETDRGTGVRRRIAYRAWRPKNESTNVYNYYTHLLPVALARFGRDDQFRDGVLPRTDRTNDICRARVVNAASVALDPRRRAYVRTSLTARSSRRVSATTTTTTVFSSRRDETRARRRGRGIPRRSPPTDGRPPRARRPPPLFV